MHSTSLYRKLPAAALAALAACHPAEKTPERPNIIIMMADDHTRQIMSCYGGLFETPNMDRLAQEGMLFERAYVANSLSGPSRACILTGKHSHKNGFIDNEHVFNGDQQTFPKLLQAGGYQTAIIGKWHLNSPPQGFDYSAILIGQGDYYNSPFIVNGKEEPSQGYVTDVITDKTIAWLEGRREAAAQGAKEAAQPFALLYYHKAPHRNWMPAPRHMGVLNDRVFPEPATLLDDYSGRGTAAREQEMELDRHFREGWDLKLVSPEQLATSNPQLLPAYTNALNVGPWKVRQGDAKFFQNAYNRMNEEEKQLWNAAYAPRLAQFENHQMDHDTFVRWKYQQYMRDYCATIMALDENIGRLLDYLEETNQLDNTLIVYTSDQGFYMGEHGWFDKRFMYEESFSTPLLVRYPKKVKAGSRTMALAQNIDFAPTFLDYAGVPIPEDIQGISLRPVLENGGATPKNWREAVYYHYYEYPAEHAVKRHYGVRNNRYKLIHFYNDCNEWELYDMEQDPMELQNVFHDPAYAEVVTQMQELLTAQRAYYQDDIL